MPTENEQLREDKIAALTEALNLCGDIAFKLKPLDLEPRTRNILRELADAIASEIQAERIEPVVY